MWQQESQSKRSSRRIATMLYRPYQMRQFGQALPASLQGKLSVEALRAVSGRVDKELAVFVEDEFAKTWVDTILRETLGADYDQVEVHAVHGDGNAVVTHRGHMA